MTNVSFTNWPINSFAAQETRVWRIACQSMLAVFFGITLLSCEEPKQTNKAVGYTGPIEEINDVKLLYSEAALLKVKLTTPKQFRYANDDRKYPKTVSIIFYGPAGEEVTTLRSDSGRYNKTKDLYTVMGNVVVINKQKCGDLPDSIRSAGTNRGQRETLQSSYACPAET